MSTRSRAPFSDPDSSAAAALAAAFLIVALLIGQGIATIRAQESTVRATIEDFASFASERIAAELNSTFSSIFLDQIAFGRSAHYAWLVGGGDPAALPARRPLQERAMPTHFSIDGDRVVTRGEPVDADTEAWILREVRAHADAIYPDPAPYALLRTEGPTGARALAYRKEEAYERLSIYGFLIRFDEFGPIYERVLDDLPILPASLSVAAEPRDLLSVRLVFPQTEEQLFATNGPDASETVMAESISAKAGRMAVRVELDARRVRALLPGGYPALGAAPFAALALLTVALSVLAIALLRRSSRLSRLREEFVASVSHDLRTPLAQMRLFTDTLLLDRLTEPEERRRALEIIRQEATSLSDLVDNLVHAAGRGAAPLRPAPTDLAHLLADTLDALAPLSQAHRATLVGRIEGPPEAALDIGAARRILINLMDNALKYGPEGQTVDVVVRNTGDFVEIVVDDQGTGIPRGERSRVWERFRRLEQSDRAATGTGIGLAVVKDLAERHGGEARIADAPGGGARAVVTLATGASRLGSAPPAAARGQPASPAAASGSGPTSS